MLELASASFAALGGCTLALAFQPRRSRRALYMALYTALAAACLLIAYLLLPADLADAPGSYFRM